MIHFPSYPVIHLSTSLAPSLFPSFSSSNLPTVASPASRLLARVARSLHPAQTLNGLDPRSPLVSRHLTRFIMPSPLSSSWSYITLVYLGSIWPMIPSGPTWSVSTAHTHILLPSPAWCVVSGSSSWSHHWNQWNEATVSVFPLSS